MNILLIDDQKSVINGLLIGVNWESLNIANVWTANNSLEAKGIIQEKSVNIMLCDIEMPGEDGISLFRWVREFNNKIECIFLTAHADFQFAKEALRLGSFDYILQPAPYDEIENAIRKVCIRIHTRDIQQYYSTFGKEVYGKKELLIDAALKDWIEGNKTDTNSILLELQKYKIYLTDQTQATYCIFQVMNWIEEGKRLETMLFRYAFSNILTELFMDCQMGILQAMMEKDTFALILYETKQEGLSREEIQKRLEEFLTFCKAFYGAVSACYIGSRAPIAEMNEEILQVQQLMKDNVALRAGVFLTSRYLDTTYPEFEWMSEWSMELIGGQVKHVKEEAYQFFEQDMNAIKLKRFYLKFMQVILAACDQISVSGEEVFGNKDNFEKTFHAFQSVDAMKRMVDRVTDYFESRSVEEEFNYVEEVIQYIHCNIENDIRRGELARQVNLNEDYLSRMFKKEKGISLKEYIILEKMKMAQNLLRNTNFSIGTISTKVGFDNFSHFSQTYRKVMGKTPVEEREEFQK